MLSFQSLVGASAFVRRTPMETNDSASVGRRSISMCQQQQPCDGMCQAVSLVHRLSRNRRPKHTNGILRVLSVATVGLRLVGPVASSFLVSKARERRRGRAWHGEMVQLCFFARPAVPPRIGRRYRPKVWRCCRNAKQQVWAMRMFVSSSMHGFSTSCKRPMRLHNDAQCFCRDEVALASITV